MGEKNAATAQVKAIEELQEKLPPERRNALGLSLVYAWIGNLEQAWRKFEERLAQPYATYMKDFRLDPAWDPLRKDPRFQNFLATHKP